jgi:hypothetical protein
VCAPAAGGDDRRHAATDTTPIAAITHKACCQVRGRKREIVIPSHYRRSGARTEGRAHPCVALLARLGKAFDDKRALAVRRRLLLRLLYDLDSHDDVLLLRVVWVEGRG